MSLHGKKHPVALSIGVLAGDDETAIRAALESLFRQSVFDRLGARHEQCEVIVLAHESHEATITAARRLCDETERKHRLSEAWSARVIEIPEQGRPAAWNRFVHEFSAVEARFLCVMDPRILFHHRDTVYNLLAVLERRPHIPASTSREVNALILKERRTLWERFSVAQTALARASVGRLCEQLYCLRTNFARSLFLPHDLASVEADFLSEAAHTELFTREPNFRRVIAAPGTAHLCAPRLEHHAFMERQTQRAMGRTALHVLLEFVRALSWEERIQLAETLRRAEASDPAWLKNHVAAHLRCRPFFWQLFPGLLTLRFKQLFALPGVRVLTHLPAACFAWLLTLVACAGARRNWRRLVLASSPLPPSGDLAPASRTRPV